MSFKLTRHTEEEIARRGITRSLLEEVLRQPQQIVDAYRGRVGYQSKVEFGTGKTYLLRVIVDTQLELPTVITAYRRSKVEKYRRPE